MVGDLDAKQCLAVRPLPTMLIRVTSLLPRRAEVTSATSANRLECARRPAARPRRDPRPRGGFSLPHLRGGEGIFRRPWIAEPELDFDYDIAADTRAHGQR